MEGRIAIKEVKRAIQLLKEAEAKVNAALEIEGTNALTKGTLHTVRASLEQAVKAEKARIEGKGEE